MGLSKELQVIDDLVRAEEYDVALSRVDALKREFAGDPSLWRMRAYVNSQAEKPEQAITDISMAIQLCAIEPDYFYTRGILFFGVGKYAEAIVDFTEVIELCDRHRSNYYREGAHFFRADAYLRLGEYDKAIADCESVRDGFQTWTDQLQSKEAILSKCLEGRG